MVTGIAANNLRVADVAERTIYFRVRPITVMGIKQRS